MTKAFKIFAVAVLAALIISGCSTTATVTAPDDQGSGTSGAVRETDSGGEPETEPASETHGTSLTWELSDFEREGILEGYSLVSTYNSETGELTKRSLGDGSGYEVGEPLRQYGYYTDGGLKWERLYIYPVYEDGSPFHFTYLESYYENWDEIPEDATPAGFEGKDGISWIGSDIADEDVAAGSNRGLCAVADFKDQGAQAGMYVIAADGLWFFDGRELTLVDDNTDIMGGLTYADMGYAPLGDVSDMSIFDGVVLSNPSHVVPLG